MANNTRDSLEEQIREIWQIAMKKEPGKKKGLIFAQIPCPPILTLGNIPDITECHCVEIKLGTPIKLVFYAMVESILKYQRKEGKSGG